ncbi:uncharacterized protein [Drosophila takahashii]|uniref:uncharacterized protein n=1 Tax=Drosophila takahashii TaxID=29030 RepID=UPI00389900D6
MPLKKELIGGELALKNKKPKTIVDLNQYCLSLIFRQIKRNCEMNDELKDRFNMVKYLDLIHFVSSSEIFKMYSMQWDPELLKRLEIEFEILGDNRHITINLEQIYDLLRNETRTERKLYWDLCVRAIRENEVVKLFKLAYKPTRYYPEHLECFEALINAISHKKSLQILEIAVDGYSFRSLPHINDLQILRVNAGMDAVDLVQLCQSNGNLRFLGFTSTELYGRFSDIVPFCNQLTSVELMMKTDIDATEYAALAKLPNLLDLRLNGYHRQGTLIKLFQDLFEMRLIQLVIRNTLLSKEETQPMASINSLGRILSGFYDEQAIANLARPWNPHQYVAIYVHPEQYLKMDQFLDLIKNCKRLHIMKEHWRLLIKFEEKLGKLILSLEKYNALKENYWKVLSHITPLLDLLDFVHLIISGEYIDDMWKIVCRCLATKGSQSLKTLEITKCYRFTLEEANAVASIPSLTTVVCDDDTLSKINLMRLRRKQPAFPRTLPKNQFP